MSVLRAARAPSAFFPMALDLGIGQAATLGFAFAFSSTVLAIKTLDEMNESDSLSGRVAVGVLIVQDVFAVGFLVFSVRELPIRESQSGSALNSLSAIQKPR
ncbi:MAG: cation:proton antiporter [Planctomycetes bacterium]|nr:cation:proton antiporter [Planctomycetota bacterium]